MQFSFQSINRKRLSLFQGSMSRGTKERIYMSGYTASAWKMDKNEGGA